MPESKYKVEVFMVDYDCDVENCDGKAVFTGKAKQGLDPKVPELIHQCLKCKKLYYFKKKTYPAQELKRVPDISLIDK